MSVRICVCVEGHQKNPDNFPYKCPLSVEVTCMHDKGDMLMKRLGRRLGAYEMSSQSNGSNP